MHTKTTFLPRLRSSAPRTAGLALAAATAVLSLSACQGSDHGAETADGPTTAGVSDGRQAPGGEKQHAKPQRLLWMGDSIAEAEAPAIRAAMKADRVGFRSAAATGGGGVIGPIAAPTWKDLPKELRSFKPDVVAYQITTYDWGTPAEQRAGYERLARTVNGAGADLLIVSAPPFKADDFYKPHIAAINSAPKSAEQVADSHPDTVHFLDASALWGTDRTAARAQRSKDGIHSCQQGSAAFAKWFGGELHARYSLAPAAVDQWATGSWTGDKLYDRLGCR